MMDTKNFTFKTGVRTFEAAAYLRRCGVDIIKEKKWFQSDLESYTVIADIVKNAVIFIDEFDATKDTILKKIIDNGLHDKVDYIELLKDIYAALHTYDFPTVLTTPSRERRMGAYRNKSLQAIVDDIREKADYIHKPYSLQIKHRPLEEIAHSYQN